MTDLDLGSMLQRSPVEPDDLLLPAGARLLHIGPHKTGTTAVQTAFVAAADRLSEHGVQYFGEQPGVRHLRGALAVTARKALLGEGLPDMSSWTQLVEEVAAAGDDRVLVSSEFFADADPETAATVVAALGGARVKVLVTLRPLAKIIASQWQQYVQNGLRMSYEDWLDRKLNRDPYAEPTPTFWWRHRHDELVERWAAAAGVDNVLVLMADESDRARLPRTFEALLALPRGFLVLDGRAVNRALTRSEAEFVRLLNREFRRRDWPEEVYRTYVRGGAVTAMKNRKTAPDEESIETPTWALDRVAEIGAEAATAIAASGVRIVGDITALGSAQAEVAAGSELEPVLPLDAAVRAVTAVVEACEPGESAPVSDRRVRDVTARQLLGVVGQRIWRRLPRRATVEAPVPPPTASGRPWTT